MSYQLKVDEMLDALIWLKHPGAPHWQRCVEDAANDMATELAAALGISAGIGSFEGVAFAGTCVPFHPAHDGQPLPAVFAEFEFDNEEEWTGA